MKNTLMIVCGMVLTAILAGCEATAKSDMAEPTWEKTASYEKIMSAPSVTSPLTPRSWEQTHADPEPSIVTHFGSYFEDPIVQCGDGNDTYGWTWLDPGAVFYSPVRYTINFIALPISMIKEPPGVLQCTDLDQPIEECIQQQQPQDECTIQ
ncbi:MAG: hypothetical protein GX629_09625 [Phycisphaerae bacterium]|nr:hypothetical protein [Phycisphaerae bacterium]